MPRPPRLSHQTATLLVELLANPGTWRYGYDLIRTTDLTAGTLYPTLIRLADSGWLTTRWEARTEGGRPPRHLYRLTGEGVRGARAMLARAADRDWALPGLPAEIRR